MTWVTEPLAYPFFSRALIVGGLVGLSCGALGVFVILRRMAYIGHGLSYGLVGGVAFAAVVGTSPYAGAASVTILAIALIDRVRRAHGLGADTAIAVVSTSLFALGAVLISANRRNATNLESLLFGNILGVSSGDIVLVGLAALAAGVVLFLYYKPLVSSTFDPETAQAQGVRVSSVNLIYDVAVAAVVIVSLRVVGVLLITAILVIPAATGRVLSQTLGLAIVVSGAVGLGATTAGLYLSYYTDVASGPAVVLTDAFTLGAAFAIAAVTRSRRTSRALRGSAQPSRSPSGER